METTTKTKVYNLIILDKSGSMQSIRRQAVDGYNETLGTVKAAQLKHLDTQQHYISLAAFCGCGVKMIYDKTPVKDAERLDLKLYDPCCNTPLYDAIGSTVKQLRRSISDTEDSAVLVTIITDGEENSSQEWTGAAVSKLIEECTELGWMFSYIGADQDVKSVASVISITNTVEWTKTTVGTKAMFDNENQARDRFYDAMACEAPSMSIDDRRENRKHLSKGYYKK